MKQIRVAAEYTAPAPQPDDLELSAIDRQQRRFFWLSIATMVVSFIHMVGALLLYSDGSWLGGAAAVLMTGLVDAATWVVTGYYDYAKRRKLKRGKLVATLLAVALVISWGLNLAYLIQHMPASLPGLVGWCIALAFSVFIPLCIATASAERGQLEDDKTVYLTSQVVEMPANSRNVAGFATQSASAVRVVSKRPASMQKRPQLAAPQSAMAMPIMTDKYAADIVAMRESSPQPSFATIGKQLGMSGEAVRQKYRAAKSQEGL